MKKYAKKGEDLNEEVEKMLLLLMEAIRNSLKSKDPLLLNAVIANRNGIPAKFSFSNIYSDSREQLDKIVPWFLENTQHTVISAADVLAELEDRKKNQKEKKMSGNFVKLEKKENGDGVIIKFS